MDSVLTPKQVAESFAYKTLVQDALHIALVQNIHLFDVICIALVYSCIVGGWMLRTTVASLESGTAINCHSL